MNWVYVAWVFAFFQIVLFTAGAYLKWFRPLPKKNEDIIFILALRKRYKSAKKPIHSSDEKLIPISEMYVYPIRGMRAGSEVDSFELGAYGIKYDREIVLVTKKDLTLVTYNKYFPMACLRQSLKGSKLTITTEYPEKLTTKGLPGSLTLEMNINPETDLGAFAVCKKGYAGYKYPDDVCKWLSIAIDKDVIAIRSSMTRKNALDPKRILFGKGEFSKTYT